MEKTFEASLAELDEIVARLENGDLLLEDSLELFEKGVRIARDCRDRLTKAERKIERLTQDLDGNLTASEFEPSSLREE